MRSFRLWMSGVACALLLTSCGGGSDSTDGSSGGSTGSASVSATEADPRNDSAVAACKDFREAADAWADHAINGSELRKRLTQVRANAIMSEHPDIVATGGSLLAAMVESDSTFAAAMENFRNACADVDL